MFKTFSYYVVRTVKTDDMGLRTAASRALAKAGLLSRKTFPYTQSGKKQADAYADKLRAALERLGVDVIVSDGFSMSPPSD